MLNRGYAPKVKQFGKIRLGNDRGSFLRLYYLPFKNFQERCKNSKQIFFLRLIYPTIVLLIPVSLGLSIAFWIVPFGAIIGEGIFIYQSQGKERVLPYFRELFLGP